MLPFVQGKEGAMSFEFLKTVRLKRWMFAKAKEEKLTNSIISHPNGSKSKWLVLLLQENKMCLDRTQSISRCQLEPGLLWWLISSSANPFLNRWIPAGSMGVVVFTDLSSSVRGDYRIAAPMQSKTIERCAWLNWLTQHSHQLGSDIPRMFFASFFFFSFFVCASLQNTS